jgi:hypothetical protein
VIRQRVIHVRDFLLQVREFRPDIRLFLLYNLFSNVGIGVFLLIYNLYLVKNGFNESFIGIYNASSTLVLAAVAMVALSLGETARHDGHHTTDGALTAALRTD